MADCGPGGERRASDQRSEEEAPSSKFWLRSHDAFTRAEERGVREGGRGHDWEKGGRREDGREEGYEPFSCFMTWLATKSAGSSGTR